MTVPPTGYPIVFKHATSDANLPAGATGYGQPMYCIRVSNTQMKVAHTQAGACWTACRTFIVRDRDKLRALSFWLPNRCV